MCTHVWLYSVFSIVNILFRRVRICGEVYVMCCFYGVDRRGDTFSETKGEKNVFPSHLLRHRMHQSYSLVSDAANESLRGFGISYS